MSKNVEALASLLNQPVETVQTALEADGGLVDRITAFRKDHTILNKADKETLVSNAKEEGKEELLANFDPKLLSKKDINRIAAWKLEDVEGEFKEKYGFEGDYRGIADLVDKIVKSKSGDNGKGSQADKDEIQKLKDQITKLSEEHQEELTKKGSEIDDFVIRTEFDRGLSTLQLDYEQDAIEKQKKLLRDSFNGSYEVKRKDGKIFVYEKGATEPIMDDKRDPLSVDTIINRHAAEYGFKIKSPGNGGQGGSSSSQHGHSKFAGMNRDAFMKELEDSNIKWSSTEGEKLYNEWRAANKQ